MMREVYAQVKATGQAFVAAHRSPDAVELGLIVALPERVSGERLASPAGVVAVLTTVPIVGRHELELEPQSA